MYPLSWLDSNHPVAEALLAGLKTTLREPGGMVRPEDALALYATTGYREEGVGNADRWHPTAEAVLADSRTMRTGIAALRSAADAYAGLAHGLGDLGAMPRSWSAEYLKGVVVHRVVVGRALATLQAIDTNDLRMPSQIEGISLAVEGVDARVLGAAASLLAVVRSTCDHFQASSGRAADNWWKTKEVAWWVSLCEWAERGMSDEDIAESWLISALNRAAARRDASSGEAKP